MFAKTRFIIIYSSNHRCIFSLHLIKISISLKKESESNRQLKGSLQEKQIELEELQTSFTKTKNELMQKIDVSNTLKFTV